MLRKFTFLVLAGALGATTACDSTGPNGDARMNVRMSADAGAQLSSVLLSDAVLAPLSAAAVDSISIRITGIEVERAQNDSTGGGWVSLSLRDSALTRINLMQLPSSDSASPTRPRVARCSAACRSTRTCRWAPSADAARRSTTT